MAAKKKEIQTTGEVDMGALIHQITNKPTPKKSAAKKVKTAIKKVAKKTLLLLSGFVGLWDIL
jgi:hypothetical protein